MHELSNQFYKRVYNLTKALNLEVKFYFDLFINAICVFVWAVFTNQSCSVASFSLVCVEEQEFKFFGRMMSDRLGGSNNLLVSDKQAEWFVMHMHYEAGRSL